MCKLHKRHNKEINNWNGRSESSPQLRKAPLFLPCAGQGCMCEEDKQGMCVLERQRQRGKHWEREGEGEMRKGENRGKRNAL